MSSSRIVLPITRLSETSILRKSNSLFSVCISRPDSSPKSTRALSCAGVSPTATTRSSFASVVSAYTSEVSSPRRRRLRTNPWCDPSPRREATDLPKTPGFTTRYVLPYRGPGVSPVAGPTSGSLFAAPDLIFPEMWKARSTPMTPNGYATL